MNQIKLALTVLVHIVVWCAAVSAQTSALTYQGELKEGGLAAQGIYEMQFRLFNSLTGGAQVGPTVTNNSVTVTDGIFSVILDFGASAFSAGADRFVEIGVHKPSDPPGFTLLSPRQPITSSPYSLKTISASAADSLSAACVTCVTDANINSVSGSKVTGTVTNAATAENVSGIVGIANGGTGSATKSFVDLSTDQVAIAGNKTFTGNVTIGGTLTTLLGQTATTVYSTGVINPGASFVLIPGLTQTINVPAGYRVYVSANGGVQTTTASTTGFSRVDIALIIDGAFVPSGNYRRVVAQNTGGSTSTIENWSISSAFTLPPGVHSVAIFAALNSGSLANVAGDSNSVLQSELTVVLVKN